MMLLVTDGRSSYRAYIELSTNREESENILIDFESFIVDETLLTLAAAHIAREANEKVMPLDAL